MVAIQFAEDIAIVETYVNPEDLVDVEEATELITKENEEEKIYQVQRGDCASTIASANDMSLTDLYKMNPGLKDNEKRIQVGDPIVVMVPEPEIKVETMVEISYTEPIYRSTVKKKDPNTYVGSSKVVDYGSDGVMEVTALVTKLNGEEIDREITDKTVLTEPASKIISVGSKPFPLSVLQEPISSRYPGIGFRVRSVTDGDPSTMVLTLPFQAAILSLLPMAVRLHLQDGNPVHTVILWRLTMVMA